MDLEEKVIDFWGDCKIMTSLELSEVAEKISNILCGGLPFITGKHNIWEETPSLYIPHSILGMLIIVGGYGNGEGYIVSISPHAHLTRYISNNNFKNIDARVNLDLHLYHLLKSGLKDYPNIEVIQKL